MAQRALSFLYILYYGIDFVQWNVPQQISFE